MSLRDHNVNSFKALLCISRSAKLILWAIFGIATIVAYLMYGEKLLEQFGQTGTNRSSDKHANDETVNTNGYLLRLPWAHLAVCFGLAAVILIGLLAIWHLSYLICMYSTFDVLGIVRRFSHRKHLMYIFTVCVSFTFFFIWWYLV